MLYFSLVRLRTESASPEKLTPELVKREIRRVHELLSAGIIRHAWKRSEGLALILLIEAANEAKCRAIFESLPFSSAGVLEIEMLIPVEPYQDVFPAQAGGRHALQGPLEPDEAA